MSIQNGKFFPINILGTFLSPTEAIRNLGVWFDSDFSFSCYVRNNCKACFVHIRDLKRLRGYLTSEAALLAENALVGSRLDYCNFLFRSLSALDLRRLQCVQTGGEYHQVLTYHSGKKESSLVAYHALLCF